jgi:hypothetical protein
MESCWRGREEQRLREEEAAADRSARVRSAPACWTALHRPALARLPLAAPPHCFSGPVQLALNSFPLRFLSYYPCFGQNLLSCLPFSFSAVLRVLLSFALSLRAGPGAPPPPLFGESTTRHRAGAGPVRVTACYGARCSKGSEPVGGGPWRAPDAEGRRCCAWKDAGC